MSKSRQKLNIVFTLVLLVLAFLSTVAVSWSYFSAVSEKSGELSFSMIDVRFLYVDKNDETQEIPSGAGGELGTLLLYPTVTTIFKNEPFDLALSAEDDPIKSILIKNMDSSCSVYVRFWVDAYIIDDDGYLDMENNYGKYFLLSDNEDYTNTGSSVAGSSCYFVKDAIDSIDASSNFVDLGKSLKVADLDGDNVPDSLMGSKLKVSISFEAVQSKNGAFQSVFGGASDTKGYYTNWR